MSSEVRHFLMSLYYLLYFFYSFFTQIQQNQFPNQYISTYVRNNHFEANYDDLLQIYMKYNIRAICETQKSLNFDYHLQRNTSNKYTFDNNFVVDGYHKLVYCFHEKVTILPNSQIHSSVIA